MENEREALMSNEVDDNYGDSSTEKSEKAYTFEEAVKATGYGWFHYILLLLCGWAVSSDAIEVLCVSFLLPSAECDLKMDSKDKGWLNAVVFIGMMVGGYFWGTASDSRGRRSVLLWSLLVNGLGGLASSFAQTFSVFLVFRLISGIGVGGSIPVIFSYFVEFQPLKKRGSTVSMLATFWMTGNMIAAGLAWAIIPHPKLGYFSDSFDYNSWRIFVAVCTIPSLTSAFFFIFMPESPRFLMKIGKNAQALEVFRIMHNRNTRGQYGYKVKRLIRDEAKYEKDFVEIKSTSCWPLWCKRLWFSLRQVLFRFIELMRAEYRRVTIISIIIYFTLSFGYYGLWMWLPEMFSRAEQSGGSVCSEISTNVTINSSHCLDPNYSLSTRIFWEGFITASSNLPGNIISILFMDRLGRKALLSGSMVVSGISVAFIPFVHTHLHNILLSCLFGGVSVIGWNALDVLAVELFPTHLRSTSMGFQTGVGRIASILGNVVFGELISVHCAVPLVMVAAFMTIGGLSALKLPNTTYRELT